MKQIKFVIFIFLFSTLQSCYTTQAVPEKTDAEKINKTRNSWMGVHEKNLYAHSYWGIPDRTGTDGAGGKIATYSRADSYYSPYTGYISVTWVTSFYIGADGVIYDMKVRRE